MKKLLLLIAAMLMCSAMAACGENTSATADEATTQAVEATENKTTAEQSGDEQKTSEQSDNEQTTAESATEQETTVDLSGKSEDFRKIHNYTTSGEFKESIDEMNENLQAQGKIKIYAEEPKSLVMEFQSYIELTEEEQKEFIEKADTFSGLSKDELGETLEQMNVAIGTKDASLVIRVLDPEGKQIYNKKYSA